MNLDYIKLLENKMKRESQKDNHMKNTNTTNDKVKRNVPKGNTCIKINCHVSSNGKRRPEAAREL